MNRAVQTSAVGRSGRFDNTVTFLMDQGTLFSILDYSNLSLIIEPDLRYSGYIQNNFAGRYIYQSCLCSHA